MFQAIVKAFGQLSDPATRRVLWKSLIATAVLFVLLVIGAEWVIAHTHLFERAMFNWLAELLGSLLAVALALYLFPAAVLIVLGFFVEEVAALVEARYYPGLPPPRVQSLSEVIGAGSRFALVAVGLNLLALPFIAALSFVPPFNLLLFYLLNGYLLGREYFELVALRRLSPREAKGLRQAYAGRFLLAGAAITFLSTVPVANLLTPVVATAFMVHMVESLRESLVAPQGGAPQ